MAKRNHLVHRNPQDSNCKICHKPIRQKAGPGRPKTMHPSCKGRKPEKRTTNTRSLAKIDEERLRALEARLRRAGVLEQLGGHPEEANAQAAPKVGDKFNFRGTQFTIVAIKPSRPKYPIVGQNIRGTRYRFSLQQVRTGNFSPEKTGATETPRSSRLPKSRRREWQGDESPESPSSTVCDVCGSSCKLKKGRWGTTFWGCVNWPTCWGKCSENSKPSNKTLPEVKVTVTPIVPDFSNNSHPCSHYIGSRRGACRYPASFQISSYNSSESPENACKLHYGHVFAQQQERAHAASKVAPPDDEDEIADSTVDENNDDDEIEEDDDSPVKPSRVDVLTGGGSPNDPNKIYRIKAQACFIIKYANGDPKKAKKALQVVKTLNGSSSEFGFEGWGDDNHQNLKPVVALVKRHFKKSLPGSWKTYLAQIITASFVDDVRNERWIHPHRDPGSQYVLEKLLEHLNDNYHLGLKYPEMESLIKSEFDSFCQDPRYDSLIELIKEEAHIPTFWAASVPTFWAAGVARRRSKSSEMPGVDNFGFEIGL